MTDEKTTEASKLAQQDAALDESVADSTQAEDKNSDDLAPQGEEVSLDEPSTDSTEAKQTAREMTKAGIIRKVEASLNKGEAINPNDKWALEYIDDKSSTDKEIPAPSQPVDFEAQIEAYEAKKQFKSNKTILDSLPSNLRTDIINEANSLKGLGTNIDKALQYVLDKNESKITSELGHSHNRKLGAALPKQGKQKSDPNSITTSELAKLSQEEYNKVMEKIDAKQMKEIAD